MNTNYDILRISQAKLLTLTNKGAKIIHHSHIIDHWFVDNKFKSLEQKNKTFESEKGFGLRIREEDNEYNGTILTTLEVKRLAKPNHHELCIEHEITVPNYKTTVKLLNLMNLKEFCTIDKERLIFNYKKCKVVINKIVNFAAAIEIEIVTTKKDKNIIRYIKTIATSLNLNAKQLTDKSVT